MSATCSIYIDAPVEDVFAFYRDPVKLWSLGPDQMRRHGELIDVTTTEEGVGSYYSWAMKLPGLRMEGFDVFTEFVPNQRITDRSSRSFVGTWTTTFAPVGTGTRVTAQRHPSSSRLWRPVDRLMDRFRVAVELEEMQSLKALLEKRTPPATASAASERGSGG